MKNIHRVFLFGDSWIEGQGTYSEIYTNEDGSIEVDEPNIPYGHDMGMGSDEKTISGWRKKNSWNLFFKEKYGLHESQIINYGSQGSDNYIMFNNFNKIFDSFQKTDLILFGFTSKYRDVARAFKPSFNTLINHTNPIHNQLSFEKSSLGGEETDRINKEQISELSKIEREVSKEYMRDHFISVFDESIHENMAQSNYLFYQKWCKAHDINILFFDLFEPYVDTKFVGELYEVDKTMYITYDENPYNQRLVEYELENYKADAKYSIWECGHTFPKSNLIYHPNQHGYKVMFDDISINHIDTQYKLTTNLI